MMPGYLASIRYSYLITDTPRIPQAGQTAGPRLQERLLASSNPDGEPTPSGYTCAAEVHRPSSRRSHPGVEGCHAEAISGAELATDGRQPASLDQSLAAPDSTIVSDLSTISVSAATKMTALAHRAVSLTVLASHGAGLDRAALRRTALEGVGLPQRH
ncbi:hypothetical protein GQ53DRAFT_200714 [Thozetella sp. PMI_491]|nr:hypothetical protein GQ53DRAFT_200714 [Thozetella sp. PMI_491]